MIAGIACALWSSGSQAPQDVPTGIPVAGGALCLAAIAIVRAGIIEVLNWIWAGLDAIGSRILAAIDSVRSLLGWN